MIDPAKPQQVLQAQWQTSVQLGREKGQPVLVLDGRPKIAFGAAGALTADQIRMYMRELEGAGTEGIAIGGSKSESKFRLAPDRLLATGRVEIASPTFTGRTQQLHTVFRLQPDAAPAAGPAGAVSPAAAAASSCSPNESSLVEREQILEILLGELLRAAGVLGENGSNELALLATVEQPIRADWPESLFFRSGQPAALPAAAACRWRAASLKSGWCSRAAGCCGIPRLRCRARPRRCGRSPA